MKTIEILIIVKLKRYSNEIVVLFKKSKKYVGIIFNRI